MANVLNPAQQLQRLQQQFQEQQLAGKGKADQQYLAVIPGLSEALTESMIPLAHKDTTWTLEEIVQRVQDGFKKAAKKYETDLRAQKRATAVDAQAIIEELVCAAMSSMSAECTDKPWFSEADFSPAFMVLSIHTFRGTSLFSRTLGPLLKRYVDNAVARYREEERMQKVMRDAVVAAQTGLSDSIHKRLVDNLQQAYDEAHVVAPYGSSAAATPEVGLLQDFVKCWLSGFVSKCWDVLENGVVGGKEQHQAFLLAVFLYMTDPSRSILPQEIAKALDNPVPQAWPFIAEAVESVMAEREEKSLQPSKKLRGLDEGVPVPVG